jgi:hypothetical protein
VITKDTRTPQEKPSSKPKDFKCTFGQTFEEQAKQTSPAKLFKNTQRSAEVDGSSPDFKKVKNTGHFIKITEFD